MMQSKSLHQFCQYVKGGAALDCIFVYYYKYRGDFGCKLGKLLRLSPQLREKREKRKVAVSASPTNFSSGFAAASRVSFGNALLIAVFGDSSVTGEARLPSLWGRGGLRALRAVEAFTVGRVPTVNASTGRQRRPDLRPHSVGFPKELR